MMKLQIAWLLSAITFGDITAILFGVSNSAQYVTEFVKLLYSYTADLDPL